MFFSDKITLRLVTYMEDAEGYRRKAYVDTEVWADAKSVTRSEFYSANASGKDASISFEVHNEDWSDQQEVIYNNKEYEVIRAYRKGLGNVVLTCSDKAV